MLCYNHINYINGELMPEGHETEVKFALDDPAQMRADLAHLGAVARGAHTELNLRLDDDERSLSSQGIVLRLRRVETDSEVKHILTVKTPVQSSDAFLSVRREIELAVSDGPAMLAALEVLGYRPYWRYEKRRETHILGAVEAVLDELPFGWFMELEGPQADIRALADRLGLNLADGLTLSYADIFDNVRRALGLSITDLTFEAFAGVAVPSHAYRDSAATPPPGS